MITVVTTCFSRCLGQNSGCLKTGDSSPLTNIGEILSGDIGRRVVRAVDVKTRDRLRRVDRSLRELVLATETVKTINIFGNAQVSENSVYVTPRQFGEELVADNLGLLGQIKEMGITIEEAILRPYQIEGVEKRFDDEGEGSEVREKNQTLELIRSRYTNMLAQISVRLGASLEQYKRSPEANRIDIDSIFNDLDLTTKIDIYIFLLSVEIKISGESDIPVGFNPSHLKQVTAAALSNLARYNVTGAALSNLVRYNAPNQDAIREAGGIPPLVALLSDDNFVARRKR